LIIKTIKIQKSKKGEIMKSCKKFQFRLSEPRFFEEMPKDIYRDAKRQWMMFMQKMENQLIRQKFLKEAMDYEN